METLIEIGRISSRGQIAIPVDIREHLGLEDGTKVLFFTENDTLLMKKVTEQSFAQITKPLKLAAKKVGMKESDVSDIVHRFRKSNQ
ncbi:MAG TPA: AbrB/MazE/SpoVT family DNA-binding domain-containing protein [Candidatus Nanoarchaeia archaeon]|nr:AbrB/MazE/SpoVT family DNA-binding domain-containing protein [Candidatus Nanoarchaeia archaeon]